MHFGVLNSFLQLDASGQCQEHTFAGRHYSISGPVTSIPPTTCRVGGSKLFSSACRSPVAVRPTALANLAASSPPQQNLRCPCKFVGAESIHVSGPSLAGACQSGAN